MTTPTVIELPPALQPVVPNTFVFAVVRDGDPRPAGLSHPSARRIVD